MVRTPSQHIHINLLYRALTAIGIAGYAIKPMLLMFFSKHKFGNTSYSTFFPVGQPIKIDPCFHTLGFLTPLDEKQLSFFLVLFFFLVGWLVLFFGFFFFLTTCISQKFLWSWGLLGVGWAVIGSMLSRARSFSLCCSTCVSMPNK